MNDNPLEIVLDRLKNVKKSSGGWMACCPAHDDKKASLSVRVGDDGRVLLKCFAGCKFRDIVAAMGLEVKNLFSTNSDKKFEIEKTYDYRNEQGELVFQSVRLKPKDFKQRRPGPDGWIWNLKGVKTVLYRLPEILNERTHKTVIVSEGEKDVDNLVKLGFSATTSPMGAGKWRNYYNDTLKDATVILLPDNHDTGYEHSLQIAHSPYGIAKSIRIIKLPGLPHKGDVSDWIEAGSTAEQFKEIAKSTPLWKPSIQTVYEDKSELSLTDTGNAKRLVHNFGDSIRYNKYPHKDWLIWNGSQWVLDITNMIYSFADKTVQNIYKAASEESNAEERKKIAKWAKSSEKSLSKKGMVFLASTIQEINITSDELDSNRWLFNCANCTLKFKDDNLLPEPKPIKHNPSHYITKISPVKYDPEAICPNWDKFLKEIFDKDESLIQYIQRIIGYCLCGETSEQSFYFCHGTGANGKSIFFSTLEMLFGDYFHKSPVEMIMQQKYSGIPDDIANLKGKRIVVCSEVEENRRLNETVIKDISGGDSITGRRLYENKSTFKPECKLFIYGNHEPQIRGSDYGIWRRVKKIPFSITIPEEQQIPDVILLDSFKKELSGILSWSVAGYISFRENGMREPEIVKLAVSEYKNEMDLIQRYISENCVVNNSMSILTKKLYENFKLWSEENGEYLLGNRKFLHKIKEKGFKTKQGHARKTYIHGLDIRVNNGE